eukprot:scaffold219108_cov17-Tisochrysis_lutea.AAC.1
MLHAPPHALTGACTGYHARTRGTTATTCIGNHTRTQRLARIEARTRTRTGCLARSAGHAARARLTYWCFLQEWASGLPV